MKIRKLTLIAIAFAWVLTPLQAKETVNLGAVFSLTGGMQMYGHQLRDGALLCVKDQAEKEDAVFDYKIIMEDDALGGRQALLGYNKLTKMDGCDVVLSNWSHIANAIVPSANRDKKITLSISWDDSVAKNKMAFIHCTQPGPQGVLLARALSELGVKKVAVLTVVQQGFLAAADAVVSESENLGMDVELMKFNPGEVDFRSHLLKLRQFEPDAYVVLAFQPEFGICLKRLKEEVAADVYIASVEAFGYLDDLNGYDGCFYTDGNKPSADFAKHFNQATQKEAIGYVGLGYDMAGVVIDAYERAGRDLGHKPTTDELSDYLLDISTYQSVLGSLDINENGVIQSPATLKYIEDGKIEFVTINELKEKLND